VENHKYGFIADGKVYLKGFLDYPDRQIGEVRIDEESSLNYFVERFELVEKKVNDLEAEIENAENKGSYLMKLLHLKKTIPQFDALGDFEPLLERLNKREAELNQLIELNRVKNLEIKKGLLAELEVYKDLEDLQDANEKVHEIKTKWIRTGGVSKNQEEEVEAKFQQYLDEFYGRKNKAHKEYMEKLEKNVIQYELLLAEAEKQSQNTNIKTANFEMKKLMQRWKDSDPIPAERRAVLWDKFFNIKKNIAYKAKMEYDRRKAPPMRFLDKEQVYKKALEFKGRKDSAAVVEIKRLLMSWNKAGKIAPYKFKQIAEEFYTICDEVIEYNFLETLATKSGGFAEKDPNEQIKQKIYLLKDLIIRDENELRKFQENYNNYHKEGQPINKLLSSKLDSKRRKLRVKKRILRELKEKLSSI
jgi:hypothetical protein